MPSPTLSDLLRKAVRETDLPLDRIAKASGISTPALWAFMAEGDKRRDIRLGTTADKLAAYLGLTLTPIRSGAKKPAKAPAKRKRPTA